MFLLAPTNGTVLTVGAAIGAVLKAGDEGIIEIGDPSRVWLEADVSEDDAARITCGQHATVESLRGGRSAEAKVEVLTAQVDPATRRRRVYLAPSGEGLQWLTPGLLVEVRLSETVNDEWDVFIRGMQRLEFLKRIDCFGILLVQIIRVSDFELGLRKHGAERMIRFDFCERIDRPHVTLLIEIARAFFK